MVRTGGTVIQCWVIDGYPSSENEGFMTILTQLDTMEGAERKVAEAAHALASLARVGGTLLPFYGAEPSPVRRCTGVRWWTRLDCRPGRGDSVT